MKRFLAVVACCVVALTGCTQPDERPTEAPPNPAPSPTQQPEPTDRSPIGSPS